jgi:hypothetical protein
VTLDAQPLSHQLDVILNEVKNLSRSGRTKKVAEVRWVNAPQSSLPGAPAVQGVALAANEAVQWSWTHTVNGSYVSGYSIVKKTTPRRVILSAAKNLRRSGRATPTRRKQGINR